MTSFSKSQPWKAHWPATNDAEIMVAPSTSYLSFIEKNPSSHSSVMGYDHERGLIAPASNQFKEFVARNPSPHSATFGYDAAGRLVTPGM
jgi:hypothetical protein